MNTNIYNNLAYQTLQDEIDALRNAFSGVIPEAPNTGDTYARQSNAWSDITPQLNAVTNLPTTYMNRAMTNQNIAADLQMNGFDILSTSGLGIETTSGNIAINSFGNLDLAGDSINIVGGNLDLNQNIIVDVPEIQNLTSDISINTGVGFHAKFNNSVNLQGNRIYNVADGLLA